MQGDKNAAYGVIRTMLLALDDPYTRFLTPDQYESLVAAAKGGSAGTGVQLALDPKSGAVVIVTTVKNYIE